MKVADLIDGQAARTRARRVGRSLPVPTLRAPAAARPEEPPPHPTDREMTLELIDALSCRAEQALSGDRPDSGLPHPLTTDRNIGIHLDRATEAQQLLADNGRDGGITTIGVARRLQAKLNEAVIHCIHQLDHRDRQQRARIDELEAALAETVRRTQVLERIVMPAGPVASTSPIGGPPGGRPTERSR